MPDADWRGERDAKIDVLHERLTAAVESLVTGDDWGRAMVFAARFRSRSFNNTLLIWAQHAERFEAGTVAEPWPTYVAGFRQWQSLGREVVKGQRGYMILAPVTKRWAVEPSEPGVLGPSRPLSPGEKLGPDERVYRQIVNVKPAYVWDVCQTDGGPVPQRPMPVLLEGEAPKGLWDGLAGLVAASGFELSRVDGAAQIGGANGVKNYTDRSVKVRCDMDDAAMVKTLAHELAHVRMHDPADAESWHHRGIGEVEAESVAMMVGAAHGMSTESYTIPYVSGWATTVKDKTPVEVVQATGARVRATALAILDSLDTVQVGGGDPPGLDRAGLAGLRQGKSSVFQTVQVPPLAGQQVAADAMAVGA